MLACAFGGGADYLVSLDADLLELSGMSHLGALQIVTPMNFLAIIKEEQKEAA